MVVSATVSLCVPLDEQEITREEARKKQELKKIDSLIAAKSKKLQNKDFLERSPEAVVEKERESLKELEGRRATTSQVLTNFAALKKQGASDKVKPA